MKSTRPAMTTTAIELVIVGALCLVVLLPTITIICACCRKKRKPPLIRSPTISERTPSLWKYIAPTVSVPNVVSNPVKEEDIRRGMTVGGKDSNYASARDIENMSELDQIPQHFYKFVKDPNTHMGETSASVTVKSESVKNQMGSASPEPANQQRTHEVMKSEKSSIDKSLSLTPTQAVYLCRSLNSKKSDASEMYL